MIFIAAGQSSRRQRPDAFTTGAMATYDLWEKLFCHPEWSEVSHSFSYLRDSSVTLLPQDDKSDECIVSPGDSSKNPAPKAGFSKFP
jgi:hypothetical protein